MDRKSARYFLKDSVRKTIDFRATDQSRGVPAPAWLKPPAPDAPRVALPGREEWEGAVGPLPLLQALTDRASLRHYGPDPLSLEELAFLLWATQGVRGRRGNVAVLRTVPSAGARHSFETYLFARSVTGLEPALYRFLADAEELVLEKEVPSMEERLTAAVLGQAFVGRAPVTFVWSAVPYRMEWRYSLAAHRAVLLDAGHVCQNLYLACQAVGAGTCAIAAYDQEALDELMGLDGEDEFALYLAPVGKPGTQGRRIAS